MVYKHAISTVVPARNPRPAGAPVGAPGAQGAGLGGVGVTGLRDTGRANAGWGAGLALPRRTTL